MTEPARAKVNLFLHVGARRDDGYHDLTSLVVFPEIGDALHAEAHDALELELQGPFAAGLDGHDNLVLRAARALQAHAPVRGARLTLTKNLPIASGIGGGSADAAAALRALTKLWELDLPAGVLHDAALTLGSDVSACLESTPVWMEGRGERLSTAPQLPRFWLVLANPGVAVSTAEVFRRLTERSGAARPPAPRGFATAQALVEWLRTTRNDLERPAMAIAPAIADVLARLRLADGCLLARMSGSGATCFGMFSNPADAERAVDGMRAFGWTKAGCVMPVP